jgi:anti-anti-sigma regulatory factor
MLVDVEGELDAPALQTWGGLLRSAVREDVTGIAVDLRACPAIDVDCLAEIVAASVELKARGDSGANVVTIPESRIEHAIQAAVALKLHTCSSAAEALRSLRDAA